MFYNSFPENEFIEANHNLLASVQDKVEQVTAVPVSRITAGEPLSVPHFEFGASTSDDAREAIGLELVDVEAAQFAALLNEDRVKRAETNFLALVLSASEQNEQRTRERARINHEDEEAAVISLPHMLHYDEAIQDQVVLPVQENKTIIVTRSSLIGLDVFRRAVNSSVIVTDGHMDKRLDIMTFGERIMRASLKASVSKDPFIKRTLEVLGVNGYKRIRALIQGNFEDEVALDLILQAELTHHVGLAMTDAVVPLLRGVRTMALAKKNAVQAYSDDHVQPPKTDDLVEIDELLDTLSK